MASFFASQLNPIRIIYRYLYKLVLGKVMMTQVGSDDEGRGC